MGGGASADRTVVTSLHSSSPHWKSSDSSVSFRTKSSADCEELDKDKAGQWEACDLGINGPQDTVWRSYDKDTNERLEKAFREGKETCQIVLSGRLYVVHFPSMVEKAGRAVQQTAWLLRIGKRVGGLLGTDKRRLATRSLKTPTRHRTPWHRRLVAAPKEERAM